MKPSIGPPRGVLPLLLVAVLAFSAGVLVRSLDAQWLELLERASSARVSVGARPERFATLPPGASLPSSAECAAWVRGNDFEPRPENASANQSTVRGGPYIGDVFREERITGQFTGTTDAILQWGACKWGMDEDIVRATAVQESWWRMSEVGDGGASFGILQVKRTVHLNTFPAAQESTAFNVDYALAYRRACFEGQHTWMRYKNPAYRAGDEWGCVGSWFSGNWYDGSPDVPFSGANWYIAQVREHLASRTWARADF